MIDKKLNFFTFLEDNNDHLYRFSDLFDSLKKKQNHHIKDDRNSIDNFVFCVNFM